MSWYIVKRYFPCWTAWRCSFLSRPCLWRVKVFCAGNRRRNHARTAEKEPGRKQVDRQEWLTEKGQELYSPWVSQDGFPGVNMVEECLSLMYISCFPLDFFVLHHVASTFFSSPELITIVRISTCHRWGKSASRM